LHFHIANFISPIKIEAYSLKIKGITMSRLLMSLGMLLICLSSTAGVSVTVPKYFEIISIDDEAYEQPASFDLEADENSLQNIIQLTPGNHKLVVKYSDSFSVPSNEQDEVEQELIHSRPLIIVVDLENNYQYSIQADRPKSYQEAREFASNPTYNLVRQRLGDPDAQSETIGDSAELQRLKRLWNNTSDSDKQHFLKWVENK
jgi:uncharacterized protein YccT (UPF0319 family)